MDRPTALVLGLPFVRRALLARAVSAVGTGLTMPFLMIYLHSVRGFELGLAGAIAACIAAVGLLGNPLGGWLADRSSPRFAMIFGLTLAAFGAASWTMVTGPRSAFAAAALSGLGVSISWPAQNALLAILVGPAQRSSVFAVGNAALNVGLALGGLLAASVVDTAQPDTFVLAYLIDAATFVTALAVVVTVRADSVVANPACTKGMSDHASAPEDRQPGYRNVLRDRVLRTVWLVTAGLSTAGFAQFTSTLPLLATTRDGLVAGDVGLVFAANTIAVVVLQLIVMRILGDRLRTRVLAVLSLLWALCWCLLLLAGSLDDKAAVLSVFLVVGVVFGLGETLVWPTLPVIVNDISPTGLRGRYNGAFTLALTTGFIVGPMLGGFALSEGKDAELLIALTAACIVCAGAARWLERLLPETTNLIPGSDATTADTNSPSGRDSPAEAQA